MKKWPLIFDEYIRFLIEDKAYWLTPIVVLCLLLMILAVLGNHPATTVNILF